MRYRVLEPANISISEVGLGCASYWGKQRFPEAEAIGIVHLAIEKGVTFFDTGHSYSEGNAEIRLGKALQGIRNKNELCISTKAGTRIGNKGRLFKDFSPEWIRESCTKSLANLGIDTLPMFSLHGPNTDNLNDETINELIKLKKEGKIKLAGVNTFDDNVILKIIEKAHFDFVMLDYNILSQNRESLIDDLFAKGVHCIAGAPLADSLFSNRILEIKGIKDLWYLARAVHSFRGKMIKGLHFRFVNQLKGITGAQVALAYVLRNKKIMSAVFGTTSRAHLLENIKASDLELQHELIQEIKQAYHRKFWFERTG